MTEKLFLKALSIERAVVETLEGAQSIGDSLAVF
jgi:hypothetical protein